MRIMIINRHMDNILGGSEIQCDLIAENLKKLGHDVTYIALESSSINTKRKYEIIPLNKITINNMNNVINAVNPDIIYWRYNKNHLLKASIISKIKKKKFVFSLSSVNDTKRWGTIPFKKSDSKLNDLVKLVSNYFGKFKSAINYNAYNYIDGVVSLKKDFLDKLPSNIPDDKKCHIYNSMKFNPDSKFNWKRPFIVWVANIKKTKNPEYFIRLAKDLENNGIDFIMIGKIHDKSYNYILDKFKLPTNFYYLGSKTVHEVDSILKEALFMVHTCNPEGFGNNFIQAWYAGIPTVSLFFDPDNLIMENKIGYFSGNYNTFLTQVTDLIQDYKLREEMGFNAKKLANELFDPVKNTISLEKFFKEILDSHH